MKHSLVLVIVGLFAATVFAQEEDDFAPVPAPPDLPDPLESGQPLEPQITLVPSKDGTIAEYRMNGRLYMVKVMPDAGPAYYLVDRDGDGQLEARMSEIYDDFQVPQWVLFSW